MNKHNKQFISKVTNCPKSNYVDGIPVITCGDRFIKPRTVTELLAYLLYGNNSNEAFTKSCSTLEEFLEKKTRFTGYLASTQTLRRDGQQQCSVSRARSFDELVVIVNNYFPTVHYLKIFEYLVTLRLFEVVSHHPGNQVSVRVNRTAASYCSTINRIVVGRGYRDLFVNLKPETNSKQQILEVIKADNKHPLNRVTVRMSSVKSWIMLTEEYLAKYKVSVDSLPCRPLAMRDMAKMIK